MLLELFRNMCSENKLLCYYSENKLLWLPHSPGLNELIIPCSKMLSGYLPHQPIAHFPILSDKYAALADYSGSKSTHSSLKGTQIVTITAHGKLHETDCEWSMFQKLLLNLAFELPFIFRSANFELKIYVQIFVNTSLCLFIWILTGVIVGWIFYISIRPPNAFSISELDYI